MKPISTLMSPLPTVDLSSGLPANAQSERSDVTAVPALGVIAEAVVALVLADAMLDKFGGDSLGEMRRNYRRIPCRAGVAMVRPARCGRGVVARHVVLVGLPGVGKSTVGRLVSEGLGAPLIDIDQLLVRQVGRPVEQIFGMMGEPYFRQLERDAVLAALAGDPAVIVPGGGWAAQPGQIEAAMRGALIIYLKCTAGTAARRSEQGETRPLIAGPDPVQRMSALLLEREPFYLRLVAS